MVSPSDVKRSSRPFSAILVLVGLDLLAGVTGWSLDGRKHQLAGPNSRLRLL